MAPDKDQNHSARDKNHSTAISTGSHRDKNHSAIISMGSNHSKSLGGSKNNLKTLGDSMQGGRMRSQCSSGTGSSSASSGSCNFQFFVQSDDGLNLSVNLNSDPLDWMRACSDGIRVPQHLHKPKKPTLRSNSSSSSVVLDAEKRVHCNGFGSEIHDLDGSGWKRVQIDESVSGCIGAFQNTVWHREKDSWGRELTDNGFEHAGISDQVAMGACNRRPLVQQCQPAEEAFQNKDREISRNFQMDMPVENTPQEMDCNHSMVDNLQNKSQMHKDEVKKAPVAKNLRNLKYLARGPIVVQDDNPKSRRKSSRLLPKGPY